MRSTSVKNTVVLGLAYSLLLNVLLYVGQVLIARTLSRTDYATFLVATNFVALCALFADLGLTPLFVRLFTHTSHSTVDNKKKELGELFGTMLLIRGIMTALVFFIVEFVAPLLGYRENVVQLMLVFFASLIISSRLLVIRAIGEAYLRGTGRYRQYIIYSVLDALCFASGILVIRYLKNDLLTITLIYTYCNLPGFLLLMRMVFQDLKRSHVRFSINFTILKDIMQQGLPLILGSIFLTIHNTADPLLLDRLSTPFEVSAFGAALRVQSALLFLPSVFALVIAPEATKLLKEGQLEQVKRLVTRSLTTLLVISCGFALVISVMPTLTMTLIFGGDKYVDAIQVLVALAWSFVGTSFAYFIIEMGIAEGNQWLTTSYMFVIMLISVTLDILLIPKYGALGSGFARIVAVSTGVLVLWWRKDSLRVLNTKLLRRNVISLGVLVLFFGFLGYTLESIGIHELFNGLFLGLLFFYAIDKLKLLTFSEIRDVFGGIIVSISIRRQ